jgi:hypothetical protein
MKPPLAAHVVWLLTLACPLAAQEPEPEVGARVRIRADGPSPGRFVGTVLSSDEKAITLRVADERDARVVERSAVRKLEVSRRKSKRSQGAFVGFLVGTALGAVATVAHGGSSACDSHSVSVCDVALSTIVLGVPGAAIGAIVSPGDRWETVLGDERSGGTRVQLVPLLAEGKRGVAISVSYR